MTKIMCTGCHRRVKIVKIKGGQWQCPECKGIYNYKPTTEKSK